MKLIDNDKMKELGVQCHQENCDGKVIRKVSISNYACKKCEESDKTYFCDQNVNHDICKKCLVLEAMNHGNGDKCDLSNGGALENWPSIQFVS